MNSSRFEGGSSRQLNSSTTLNYLRLYVDDFKMNQYCNGKFKLRFYQIVENTPTS